MAGAGLPGLLALVGVAFLFAAAAQQGKERPKAAQADHLKFAYERPWRGCGPVDQPESGITLTTVLKRCPKSYSEAARPYISVMFEVGAKTAPVRVLWGASQTAWATRCLAGRERCDKATGGTIDFTEVGSKGHLPSYDLQFEDGSVEKGTFTEHSDCHPDIRCW